jgi:hypothetical protein
MASRHRSYLVQEEVIIKSVLPYMFSKVNYQRKEIRNLCESDEGRMRHGSSDHGMAETKFSGTSVSIR